MFTKCNDNFRIKSFSKCMNNDECMNNDFINQEIVGNKFEGISDESKQTQKYAIIAIYLKLIFEIILRFV